MPAVCPPALAHTGRPEFPGLGNPCRWGARAPDIRAPPLVRRYSGVAAAGALPLRAQVRNPGLWRTLPLGRQGPGHAYPVGAGYSPNANLSLDSPPSKGFLHAGYTRTMPS